MFRGRERVDPGQRGSIGTSKVWDEETRAAHREGRVRGAPAVPAQSSAEEDPLVQLVARAISGIVQANLPGFDPDRRQAIAQELSLRIAAHLFGPTSAVAPELAAPPGPAPPQPAAPEPGPEVERAEPEPDSAPVCPPVPCLDHVDPLLAAELRRDLDRLGRGVPGMRELREYALYLILQEVEQERLERPRPAFIPTDPEDRRVDILERRVNKLTHSLATTQEAVRKMESLADYDPGVKSIYRVVQGLSPEDTNYDLKRELLMDVFEANLELQKRILAGRKRFFATREAPDREAPGENRVA